MEKIDIYDKNRRLTGKIVTRNKGKIDLKDGEYILLVKCWILNNNNEILLTQRRMDKYNGGMWEPTGGLASSGETSIQAIKRELLEEIGLDIQESKLQIVDKKIEKSCFKDVYLIKDDIKLAELKFNDGEVINAKYVTIDEFKQMINKKEINKWNESFLETYEKIIHNK